MAGAIVACTHAHGLGSIFAVTLVTIIKLRGEACNSTVIGLKLEGTLLTTFVLKDDKGEVLLVTPYKGFQRHVYKLTTTISKP